MSEIFGIDVAKWQGDIDWAKVAQAKQFAILKVTQKDNRIEGKFETNYREATKAGLAIGGYRYVYAKTVEQAEKEAMAIVKACTGRKLSYGIWLDMEDSSIRNLGKNTLTRIIQTEARILQLAGLPVGIYCNKDWYDNVLDSKYLATEYPFWIARYPAYDDGSYLATSKLNPNEYSVSWQYSSKGKVEGIKGNVDLDVATSYIPHLFVAEPVLRRYSTGLQVKKLQVNLNRVINANLEPDGKFGPLTNEMLRKWQGVTGLLVDGIYGPKSADRMRNILG